MSRYSTPIKPMVGKRFGSRVVVSQAGRDPFSKAITWLCQCDCGEQSIVRGNDLRGGKCHACPKCATPPAHGHNRRNNRSGTYHSWVAMKTRCTNENAKKFASYGARGIKVCKRWQSFENFLADMGERPEGKTIDRYPDNDGNYEPGNCRWATPKEQRANQRSKSHDDQY